MKILVKNCARCGQDHEVEFREFVQNGVGDLTHWGMCPVLNEPILMRIIEVDAEEVTIIKNSIDIQFDK
jgi:hypothetical protein